MSRVLEFAIYVALLLPYFYAAERVQANYGTWWGVLAVIAGAAIFGLAATRVKRVLGRGIQHGK